MNALKQYGRNTDHSDLTSSERNSDGIDTSGAASASISVSMLSDDLQAIVRKVQKMQAELKSGLSNHHSWEVVESSNSSAREARSTTSLNAALSASSNSSSGANFSSKSVPASTAPTSTLGIFPEASRKADSSRRNEYALKTDAEPDAVSGGVPVVRLDSNGLRKGANGTARSSNKRSGRLQDNRYISSILSDASPHHHHNGDGGGKRSGDGATSQAVGSTNGGFTIPLERDEDFELQEAIRLSLMIGQQQTEYKAPSASMEQPQSQPQSDRWAHVSQKKLTATITSSAGDALSSSKEAVSPPTKKQAHVPLNEEPEEAPSCLLCLEQFDQEEVFCCIGRCNHVCMCGVSKDAHWCSLAYLNNIENALTLLMLSCLFFSS